MTGGQGATVTGSQEASAHPVSVSPLHRVTPSPLHRVTPSFPDLRFPAADARAVAERFQEEGRPLYAHAAVHTLTDSQVTLANLRRELAWLKRSVRPGQVDTVVIFLSGHGVRDRSGHYFFPAYDFDPKDLAHTSLSGEELQEALGATLPARAVFLLADTCQSGSLAEPSGDDLNADLAGSGVYVLASSSRFSYESPQWGHGAFTQALLHALSRKDLARQGVIPFYRLADAVTTETAALVRAAGQAGQVEDPVIPLDGRSAFVPVVAPR